MEGFKVGDRVRFFDSYDAVCGESTVVAVLADAIELSAAYEDGSLREVCPGTSAGEGIDRLELVP